MDKRSQNLLSVGHSLLFQFTAILLVMQFGSACKGLVNYDETDADGDGFSTAEGDCDDLDVSVNPSASEANDNRDNDCDGDTDEGFVESGGDEGSDTGEASDSDPESEDPQDTGDSLDADEDGDGFTARVDCDDNDPSVHPYAEEECANNVDDDCNGLVDSNDSTVCESDGDGYTTEEGDCDDTNSLIHPGADETCNNLDDDCDGEIDEDAKDASTWYLDGDGDGYGDEEEPSDSCDQPMHYVSASAEYDCDDGDATTYPSASEICDDAADNDCDDELDEECWLESTDTFTIANLTHLMASDGGGGSSDSEFDGHGPEVVATFTLTATMSEVTLDVVIWWTETKSDWTTGFASYSDVVWNAPSGCEILELDDGTTTGLELSAELTYTDGDHGTDFVTGSGFVKWAEFIGDTGGDDLGGHIGDDAELVEATFGTVTVTITCPA